MSALERLNRWAFWTWHVVVLIFLGLLYGMGELTTTSSGGGLLKGFLVVAGLGVLRFPLAALPATTLKRARLIAVTTAVVAFGVGGLLLGTVGVTLRLVELTGVGGIWGMAVVTRPQRSIDY
jgi:hypothetical protein